MRSLYRFVDTCRFTWPRSLRTGVSFRVRGGWGWGVKIALGRHALTLHILAPSQRPVQVTKSLRSFWTETIGAAALGGDARPACPSLHGRNRIGNSCAVRGLHASPDDRGRSSPPKMARQRWSRGVRPGAEDGAALRAGIFGGDGAPPSRNRIGNLCAVRGVVAFPDDRGRSSPPKMARQGRWF